MGKLPIFKFMEISTAHISPETNEYLMAMIEDGDFMLHLFHTGYGFLINVPYGDKWYTDLPLDLKRCLEFARENDCKWLHLDCEGDVIDDLKEYIWDKNDYERIENKNK